MAPTSTLPSGSTSDMGEAYLEVGGGEAGAQRIAMDSDRLIIGRQAGVAVRINDQRVSRRHAEIFRDPFLRWWVRDLGSRNGTTVNGRIVRECALTSGDVIGVEAYTITFKTSASTQAHVRPRTKTSLTVVGDEQASEIHSLRDLAPPKIDTTQLSRLTEFGSQLLSTVEFDQRLRMLCRLMVGEAFSGRSAVAVRVTDDLVADARPQMLCDVEYAGAPLSESPYVSRTTLLAVRQSGTAVLASNAMGTDIGAPGEDVVQMSLAGVEVPSMAVVACPIGDQESSGTDVLYVTLPAEYGTGEWLALVTLACEEFRQSNVTWTARLQAQEHAIIERELERGRQIQLRLVPQQVAVAGLEVAIGFQPCRWVGGDYVDVVATEAGQVFLTVADVCGKGLQAALITASLHTMVHTNIRGGFDLADMMHRLNDYLVDTLPDDSFVTMIAMVLNLSTGELHCANAGHPPAMLIDGDGRVRRMQAGVNTPLGLHRGPIQTQADLLERGQLLALYTDGLTDLFNHQATMLGIEGVGKSIASLFTAEVTAPLKRIAGRLIECLDKHQAGQVSLDDRTFLLARRA